MRKSIKRTVFIRVAAALLSILLFSGVTTFNLLRVKGMQERSASTVAVLNRAQSAETPAQMTSRSWPCARRSSPCTSSCISLWQRYSR